MDNTLAKPKISVLMPVYNGERFIAESIHSVFNQTFTDFELLVIDDGSTDQSAAIVSSFKDKRIRLVRNEKNRGLVAVRNQAIELSRGEYLAWLDADDIALPDRLKQESSFLDAHHEVGLIGCAAAIIDEEGKRTGIVWKNATPPEKMSVMLLFHNCFTQSSVMLRRPALLNEKYREGFAPAEDYELWTRIAATKKCMNLPKVLTLYRKHRSVSGSNTEKGRVAIERITRSELQKLGINPTGEEYRLHRTNYGYDGNDLYKFLDARESWLMRLKEANTSAQRFDTKIFDEVLAERWLASCSANASGGLRVWRRFWDSELLRGVKIGQQLMSILKFAIKCSVRVRRRQ